MPDVGRGEGPGLPAWDKWHPSQPLSGSVHAPEGAELARPADVPGIPLKVGTEPATPAARAEDHPHPDHQWHAPEPRLVRDAGLWVWIWVIGAIVLIVLLIVALSAIPAKKSVGTSHHSISEASQTVPHHRLHSWTHD